MKRSILLIFATAAIILSSFAISGFAWAKPIAVNQPAQYRVTVVMYHGVHNMAGTSPWAITPGEFEADLQYLRSNGYETVTIGQLIHYVNGKGTLPPKPILLTFDDGYKNNYTEVLPLLERYDAKISLSVIGNKIDMWSNRSDINTIDGYCTWDDLRALRASGRVDIGSHTWDMHSGNGRLGCAIKIGENVNSYKALLRGDLTRLQDTLRDRSGVIPRFFAYPNGVRCNPAHEVLREMGFSATLSTTVGHNVIKKGDSNCLYDLKRVNRSPGYGVGDILRQFG